MQSSLDISAVAMDRVTLSAHDLLHQLHQRGRLLPLLREAAIEQFLVDQAQQADLTVATDELHQAANRFRHQHGLHSAEDTHVWLAKQRLSAVAFEAALECDLLIDKLKDHLTGDHIADHFEQHRADYKRLRLRQIVVDREDLVRELLSQMQEEGRDFAELARQHSQHPSCSSGGAIGLVFRCDLLPPVAAAVAEAKAGDLVGPVALPHGFCLLLVEEIQPAQMDAVVTACIRQQLFDDWLGQQLADTPPSFPILDELP